MNKTKQLKEKLRKMIMRGGLTSDDLKDILGDPWEDARGILKERKANGLEYQKRIRKEWER